MGQTTRITYEFISQGHDFISQGHDFISQGHDFIRVMILLAGS